MPTEQEFTEAMYNIYRRARNECDYNATRFLQMLTEHNGLGTARILIHSERVSDGYTALWDRGRLDLTVEALVLQPPWDELFTNEELEIARNRLRQYQYNV